MSLEDELKARTLALISQQMAEWVVQIQRQVGDHQANLVRALDELQESIARYDERIDENAIAGAIGDVVAAHPTGEGSGQISELKASLSEIEKGTSLSEALTYLVNEAAKFVDRAAIFIVKGANAIGWYAQGLNPPEVIKTVSVSLSSDTIFRIVHNSRRPMTGHISQTPGTAQALTRLGGDPQGILAIPLLLRDKLAAILYCDTPNDEMSEATADLLAILVLFAGKSIDLLSGAAKPAATTTTSSTTAERADAIRGGGDASRERAGATPSRGTPASGHDEGSTVMLGAREMASVRAQAGVSSPPVSRTGPQPAARGTGPNRPLSPEDQKAHEDAKRFARLVVSEIKLYNEAKVNDGRRSKDIYDRLKEDIERGRQMYMDRVTSTIRDSTNYFVDELVRILAGGDPSALGPM